MERYALFKPFLTCPPDRPMVRVGPPPEEDGGKWLCSPASVKAPCTIISMGSRMDFSFEEAILNATSYRCRVATLDCTVTGRTIHWWQHTFHKLCVGSSAAAAASDSIVTYSQFVSSIGAQSVPILKIDIESSEWPTFAEWTESTPLLPEQISVELHYRRLHDWPAASFYGRGAFGVSDLALFFLHMANLGYGIISVEANPSCAECAEFTLLRVESLWPRRAGGWWGVSEQQAARWQWQQQGPAQGQEQGLALQEAHELLPQLGEKHNAEYEYDLMWERAHGEGLARGEGQAHAQGQTQEKTQGQEEVQDKVHDKGKGKVETQRKRKEKPDWVFVSSIGAQSVPILKIDIESSEWPTFAEWTESTPLLPEQISVELHYRRLHGLARRVVHPHSPAAVRPWPYTAHRYGVISVEANPSCPEGAEFTFLRVEARWPRHAGGRWEGTDRKAVGR
ncbi:hypothetical protein GPECTOR_4g744 [Gonium pectorale]|uniref:Methyltransferase domain-containing protein n=1 Tax=Gonium pectorale TaxID=33097 RepID=A0A150GYB8_GONPE|nr:hypothetical protein GPECTOR_4g744 [Gonium pectorale]|eukprot:KXZ54678.1 hypothetical protein GPECTOR_4g744 [Gonium pectorale]